MSDVQITEAQLRQIEEADGYSLRHLSSEIDLLVASYRAVTAQAEALRKNSERYVWLRDKSEAVHSFYLSTPIWMTGVRFSQVDVDRSIDSAMTREVDAHG